MDDRIGLDPARNRRGRRSDATGAATGRGGTGGGAYRSRPDRRVPTGNGTAPAGPPRRRGRLTATVRRWGPSFPPRSCPAPRAPARRRFERIESRVTKRLSVRTSFHVPTSPLVASQFLHATRLTCDTSYVRYVRLRISRAVDREVERTELPISEQCGCGLH